MDRLFGVARALNALAQVDFPAPLVQRNRVSELLSANEDWVVLLLTFVEGGLVSDSVADMTSMGRLLARLHLIPSEELRAVETGIPDYRYYPQEKLNPWLTKLKEIEGLVPTELESRHESCVRTLTRLQTWPELPISLLHGDCNPQNAIRSERGQITFIDWDNVGFGPAILDLAYLLFHCHICQPSWPTIEPNEEWIGGILSGYEQYRSLSSFELEYLPDAIALAECHHLAKRLPAAVQEDWTQDRMVTRFFGREHIVTQISEIALTHCGKRP